MNMRISSTLLCVFLMVCMVLFQNCGLAVGPSSVEEVMKSNSQRYFQTTKRFVVNVYYEPGAEPFVGTTTRGMEYWSILEENLRAAFQYRTSVPVVFVPKTLNEMSQIPNQSKVGWTSQDLVALDFRQGSRNPSAEEEHFNVFFVKGNFDDGSGPKATVLGVSLGGTRIIGMFKDVIRGTGANSAGPVPKFVEQSTLVHEMGHALGFVNNGVPMASPHQDSEHGSHTTNSDCVMYYLNEGASDLAQFVQRYIASSDLVMWGPEVLSDARALSR